MDLMLVMNERLRHQSIEQRAVFQRVVILGLVAIALFGAGFYLAATSTMSLSSSGSGSGRMEITGASSGAPQTALPSAAFVLFFLGNASLLLALHLGQHRLAAILAPTWATNSNTAVRQFSLSDASSLAYYALAAIGLLLVYLGTNLFLVSIVLVAQIALLVTRLMSQKRPLPASYGGVAGVSGNAA